MQAQTPENDSVGGAAEAGAAEAQHDLWVMCAAVPQAYVQGHMGFNTLVALVTCVLEERAVGSSQGNSRSPGCLPRVEGVNT